MIDFDHFGTTGPDAGGGRWVDVLQVALKRKAAKR